MKNLILGSLFFLIFSPSIALAQADATAPSDVPKIVAEAGDSETLLTWAKASDNVKVEGYRVHYGTKSLLKGEADQYEFIVDVKNAQEYTVKNLINGTQYYFAVFAYDKAGNESESSFEVSATPKEKTEKFPAAPETVDTIAPTVVSAEALTSTQVKVTFSESIKLPAVTPESAFTIQEYSTLELLEVKNASVDASGKSVLLTTVAQKAGISYLLTVGIDVEDLAGNPLVSGTSDTALFSGSDKKTVETPPPAETGDGEGIFEIKKIEVPDKETVTVIFSLPAALSLEPDKNFSITEKADLSKLLAISSVEMSDDHATATLKTAAQEGKVFVLHVSGLTDLSGNPYPAFDKEFTGSGTILDLIPPEDVTELFAKVLTSTAVRLTWKASMDSAKDLADQLLYQSDDLGATYGQQKSLGKTATKYDVKNLKGGQEYHFKITAKDTSGNESAGTVMAVKLPATGMGLGLFALASLGLGSLHKRKK